MTCHDAPPPSVYLLVQSVTEPIIPKEAFACEL